MQNKDLRNINEEEFSQVFNDLRKRTDNFYKIQPEILLDNNQYLAIFRIMLGLTQKQFAQEIGVSEDRIRHLEAGRQTIQNQPAVNKYTNGIHNSFLRINVDTEQALKNFKIYGLRHSQVYTEDIIKFKQISKMNEAEFSVYFKQLEKITNNFKAIEPDLFMRMPQTIIIIRSILGYNQRLFAKILEIDSKTLRNYENAKTRVSQMTSAGLAQQLGKLLTEKKVFFEDALMNFRKSKNFFGNGNLLSSQKNGLRLAKLSITEIENTVELILKKTNINYHRNFNLPTKNKTYNIDFVIFHNSEPIIAIEVFATRQLKTLNHSRLPRVDHRFQAIKLAYPDIKTILAIQFKRPILVEHVREYILQELMNTDLLLIDNEIEDLRNLLNEKDIDMKAKEYLK